MSVSQSRANSRGQLIAVIKIQIEDDQVDRIFLHQNDDDYRLAQQFQLKHRLSPAFVDHIYQKIKISRQSLVKQSQNNRPPLYPNSRGYRNPQQSDVFSPAPINKVQTHRQQTENGLSPFDRIPRFTPMKEQIPPQLKIARAFNEKSIPIASPESLTKHLTTREDLKSQLDVQKDNHRTFETFMENKTNNNQNLFQKYLQERKINGDSGQSSKFIIKSSGVASSDFQSRQTKPQQIKQIFKYGRSPTNLEESQNHSYLQDPNQTVPIRYHNQPNKIQQSNQHYSFNEDKPSRVKILNKEQIKSMRSLQESKKSISKQDREKIANQVTTRLYNESDIKKNYLNKIKERAKQEKVQKQDKQLTHHPKINKVSQIIAADRYQNIPIQDYLIAKAKKVETKKQSERAIKSQKEMQNCSFKPTINAISQKLVRNNSKSHLIESHCHNRLEDCSRKHYHSQLNFRPSINKMSEKIVKQKRQGNFQQRLKGFLEQKNSKLCVMTRQKSVRERTDQKGQQLFHPRTYSKPQNRSPKGSQIHDYLFELSKLEKPIQAEIQKPIINQNSENIVQQMYAKRITWLFSELDNDQDGFISPKRICIDSISQQILLVIIPVLFEMEQMDIQLNLQDFKNAIKNLHPSLNAHQKSVLYSYSGKN